MAVGSWNLTTYKARNLIHKINDNSNLLRVFSRDDVGISPNFDNPGFNGYFEVRTSSETTGESGTKPFNSYAGILTMKDSSNVSMLQLAGSNAQGWWVRGKQATNVTLSGIDWQRIVVADSGTYSININGNAATATQLLSAGTTAQFYRGDRIWSNSLANYIFNTTDMPEAAANLNTAATVHSINFYRNGFTIPYQIGDTNDGGMFRVRGTSESNCICEIATWDDSGAGETIQFNYYPTTSQVTPTYSVTVPKASGTIALTSHTHDGRYLRYSGWWTSGSGQNLDNASGMIFAYNNHGHPGIWGVVATFDYSIDSAYRLQIAGDGYYNHLWFRNRSSDRGGWYTGWKRCWEVGEAITNAVWNDLGECRKSEIRDPGYIITPSGSLASERLEPGCRIISDTWGFLLGDEENKNQAPVAIAGRVLAYPYKDKSKYKIGDAVCSAPGGTVDVMTREEIMMYPDRILGIVNEIPDYDIWEPSREGGARTYTYKRSYLDRYQIRRKLALAS